jgi:hypothetical protein
VSVARRSREARRWYLEQLAADEQMARAAAKRVDGSGGTLVANVDGLPDELCHHLAEHDPDRALREVAVKRRRLGRHHPVFAADADVVQCVVDAQSWPCSDVQDDLAIYRRRPGYRKDWERT